MRRSTKIKLAVAHVPARKSAIVPLVVAAPRRLFPAWIDANERDVAPAPTTVTSRVRDGLVLRLVGQKKAAHPRNLSHGSSAR